MALDDWESTLGKPASICDDCERAFAVGDDFVSVLGFDEGSLRRREVCPACFAEDGPSAFAFWRSRVASPDARKPRPLDVNFLIDFFKRLQAGDNQARHREVGYIVTLLLVRKKILEHLPSDDDGAGETLVTRFRKDDDGPVFRVPVPEITAEKMEIIRDDLGRIFNLEEA